MKKMIVVSDCVADALAQQEIRTAVEGFLKNPASPNISFVPSSPSTIHTAFLTAQIVQTEERYGRPLETVIYQNTDPRSFDSEVLTAAQGSPLVIARLASGIYMCGPNAGFNFSLVKPKIDEIYTYSDLDKNSQFRSRDLFPRIGAYLMDALEDDLDLEEIPPDTIPDLKGYYIGHIDNFGNIKTTITLEDLKGKYEFDEEVKIKINDVEKSALFVDNLFGGIPGQLVIYPGSSGQPENPYLEITIWRHFAGEETATGVHAFNNPLPGSEIEIEK